MKLIIVKDYEAMSEAAAKEVILAVQTNPRLVLGLATGGTPEGLYQQLVAESQNNRLDWSNVSTFNLDEYVNLDAYHPLSYTTYMREKFFSKVNLRRKHTHLPKATGNVNRNAEKYQAKLTKAGGIDLQILGIGENGHIAFNEPGASKDDGIRVVDLAPETIKANARYFNAESEVPRQAITMGVGTILKAKKIILLANGEKKALAIKHTLEGPITSDVPSSFLQLHNDVTLIIDEAAASALQKVASAPVASAKAVTKAPTKVTKPKKVSSATPKLAIKTSASKAKASTPKVAKAPAKTSAPKPKSKSLSATSKAAVKPKTKNASAAKKGAKANK